MPFRNARILFGNMDIKGRIGKLKELSASIGFDELKKLMAQWESQYPKAVAPRNAVCHMQYFGTIKGKPELMVFGPSRAERGPPDEIRITVLHRDYFEYSIMWARNHAALSAGLLTELKKLPLSEFELDSPPIPQ